MKTNRTTQEIICYCKCSVDLNGIHGTQLLSYSDEPSIAVHQMLHSPLYHKYNKASQKLQVKNLMASP